MKLGWMAMVSGLIVLSACGGDGGPSTQDVGGSLGDGGEGADVTVLDAGASMSDAVGPLDGTAGEVGAGDQGIVDHGTVDAGSPVAPRLLAVTPENGSILEPRLGIGSEPFRLTFNKGLDNSIREVRMRFERDGVVTEMSDLRLVWARGSEEAVSRLSGLSPDLTLIIDLRSLRDPEGRTLETTELTYQIDSL